MSKVAFLAAFLALVALCLFVCCSPSQTNTNTSASGSSGAHERDDDHGFDYTLPTEKIDSFQAEMRRLYWNNRILNLCLSMQQELESLPATERDSKYARKLEWLIHDAASYIQYKAAEREARAASQPLRIPGSSIGQVSNLNTEP